MMVKDRFVFSDLQGPTPAIDVRQTEGLAFVLSGKNYLMDSKGVKAAFASRLLNSGHPIAISEASANVQSERGFIFTKTEAGRFLLNTSGDSVWTTSFTYPSEILTEFTWRRWTSAFIGDTVYYAHPSVGLYKRTATNWVPVDPGISNPVAVAETNGRLVVLGRTAIAWSSPGNPEDFTPALGGAGFQVLSERIAGLPFALIPIPSGYIIWSTASILVGEFIGSDLSFRHYTMQHSHQLINQQAYVRMPDGSYIFCTEQGLFVFTDTDIPQPATPIFNEFLRNKFKTSPNIGLRVRLNYNAATDLLYVQIRDQSTYFNMTFVLAVAIDKWGTFNRAHQGIIEHGLSMEPTKGEMGYVDRQGIPHRFLHFDTKREVRPGEFEGLDSEVVIGPLRAPALQRYHDVEQELQGFYLSTSARPSWSKELVLLEDDNSNPDSNPDSEPIIDDSANFVWTDPISSVTPDGDIHTQFPEFTFNVRIISDWSGFDPAGFLLLGPPTTDVRYAIEFEPTISQEMATAIHYTLLAPGMWHRLRVFADDVGEFFHITAGEFTFNYSGRLGN